MLSTLRQRAEWRFFAVLTRADAGLAFAWWLVLLLRGVLRRAVAAVQKGENLAAPRGAAGASCSRCWRRSTSR
jgi:ATP-binding cassette subfamily B protein